MLELQTIRKEHQRREQLLKLQNDDKINMDTDMAIGKKTSFITNNDRSSHSKEHGRTQLHNSNQHLYVYNIQIINCILFHLKN